MRTLRSCMRALTIPRKLPLASVALVAPLAMYSSYSWRWRRDSLRGWKGGHGRKEGQGSELQAGHVRVQATW